MKSRMRSDTLDRSTTAPRSPSSVASVSSVSNIRLVVFSISVTRSFGCSAVTINHVNDCVTSVRSVSSAVCCGLHTSPPQDRSNLFILLNRALRFSGGAAVGLGVVSFRCFFDGVCAAVTTFALLYSTFALSTVVSTRSSHCFMHPSENRNSSSTGSPTVCTIFTLIRDVIQASILLSPTAVNDASSVG